MGRYFIEVSYDGTNYSGWQSQLNANSVQETLQTAVRRVVKANIEVVGSSRTDAGVHAFRQVAQIDFEPNEALSQIIFKVNMALPNDISVLDLYQVNPLSQARFDAVSRSYRYVVSRKKDPFCDMRSLFWYGELDVLRMQEACQIILNQTDFQSFCKVHTDVSHFNCHILKAEWREENHLLFFEITANRFLRGMVRGLVGTMLNVGRGKVTLEEFTTILEMKDRKKAGENAPACGLFLCNVTYPEDIRL